MYIRMLILLRAPFFLEWIQTIQIHYKKTKKHSKTGILVKLTQNLAVNSLWTELKIKNLSVNVPFDITPFFLKSTLNACKHLQPFCSFMINALT